MGVVIVEGEGAVLWINMGHPIVTNEILCVMGGDAALSQITLAFLVFVVDHRQ